ncbi:MAG: dipeptide epimerase [Cytophagales bacterium]|nr:dipeptide epimerase [Cytophagales bacterium]
MSSFLLPYSLKNKKAFRIAHGQRTETQTLLIQIEKDGITGLGEAAHVPYYGISIESSLELISNIWGEMYPVIGESADQFWELAKSKLGKNHFALCALDIAHHDWLSKRNQMSLSSNLGINLKDVPVSSYTIGMDTFEEMQKSITETDFPYLKIKLGSEDDNNLIDKLREHSKKPFRIDVNGGWTLEYSLKMAKKLEEVGGIEFLEQPLGKGILESNGKIKDSTELLLFADETCMWKEDVKRCAPYFDGINIKLSKCGGITPALKMIKEARELNLKIMLGCMTESSAGISALAHLSPLVDFVDMDGACMISNDPVDGVKIMKGVAEFNDRFGHGGLLKDGIEQRGIIAL